MRPDQAGRATRPPSPQGARKPDDSRPQAPTPPARAERAFPIATSPREKPSGQASEGARPTARALPQGPTAASGRRSRCPRQGCPRHAGGSRQLARAGRKAPPAVAARPRWPPACARSGRRPRSDGIWSPSAMNASAFSRRPLKIASLIQGSSPSLAAIFASAPRAAGSARHRSPSAMAACNRTRGRRILGQFSRALACQSAGSHHAIRASRQPEERVPAAPDHACQPDHSRGRRSTRSKPRASRGRVPTPVDSIDRGARRSAWGLPPDPGVRRGAAAPSTATSHWDSRAARRAHWYRRGLRLGLRRDPPPCDLGRIRQIRPRSCQRRKSTDCRAASGTN